MKEQNRGTEDELYISGSNISWISVEEFGRVYHRQAMTCLLKQNCCFLGLVQGDEIYYCKFRSSSLFSCSGTYEFSSKLEDL